MKYLLLSLLLVSCAGNVNKVSMPNGEVGYELTCSEVSECDKQSVDVCEPRSFGYVFVRKESEYQYTSRITCDDEVNWK